MPGGRLTQQDRRQIALGLAEGLAYAEIARRLDRPTSTITREVTRNGGPTGYRADLAQRAAERRARRRRPASSRTAAPVSLPHGRDPDAVREYEEKFTTVLMESGLSNAMMARVLVCLYTTDGGTLTAAELVERLQVSPASISKAIKFLESQDLVRREREGRRERYVVDDEVHYQSMIGSARALARQVETMREGVAVLKPGTPAAARLENIARFLDFVGENIVRAAEQAREILYAGAGPEGAAPPGPERG